MKNYLLILFLLVAGGCVAASKENPDSIAASPGDVNSAADSTFDEFEEEFSENVVKIADPLVGLNRVFFGFNDVLYFWIIKPLAGTWKGVVPEPGRVGISNFFDNLMTPVRLVNCLLQGKCDAAGKELDRFIINTTAGILGFGDPATDRYGIKMSGEDMGQTLENFGLGDGFYLVLPLLGPSTLRDAVGRVGDMFLNPVYYVKPDEAAIGMTATGIINESSFHIGEYEAFKSAAVDPYVAMRDAYVQYRKNQIRDEDQQIDPNSAKQ
jgi:phospholipid-binding lipoprotein MlaA